MKNCVLEDDKACSNCNKCNICDLEDSKICNNCCKCLNMDEKFAPFFVKDLVEKHLIVDGEIVVEPVESDFLKDN